METALQDWQKLHPQGVADVIQELRLQQEGAIVYYAIDPHEVYDFCFPVDLIDSAGGTEEIKTIADAQVALYEIFYKQRAILLPEYEREIRRIKNYYDNTFKDVHKGDSQLVDRLIEQGNLGSIGEGTVTEKTKFLRENFNVLLAIAMGIFRFGVRRFDDVTDLRLKTNLETEIEEDRPTLRRIFVSYSRTPLERILFEELKKVIGEPDKLSQRRERAAGVDAGAIDRMIYLNAGLEKAYQEKELSRRYIILYLSSAARTRRLFSRPVIRNEWPIIKDKPFNFWRTREQVFSYVVHKSSGDDLEQTIRNLERVQDILAKVQILGAHFAQGDSACADCLLKGGNTQNCRFLDLCTPVNDLDKEIQERRQQIHNLGLINTLESYKNLRDQGKPDKERQKEYFSVFKSVFNSPLANNAKKEMGYLQEWILIKSDFTNSFTESFGIGKARPKEYILRSGEDAVTGIDQYLPTKPKIRNTAYLPILNATLEYYRNPSNVALIEKAYKLFLERDTDIGPVNLEHELVRCLLYLAFPRPPDSKATGGDEKAYRLAKRLLETNDLVDPDQRKDAPEWIGKEYAYLLCWAARRTSRFKESAQYAKKGLAEDPMDPRFYHGLCLNTYSWLTRKPNDPNLTSTLEDAITYATEAIRCYRMEEEKGIDNRAVIAANHNNLAYFWTWKVQRNICPIESRRNFLAEARRELDKLKGVIDKDRWVGDRHPEFFHTEAYLEYEEFLLEWELGNRHKAKRKLGLAMEAMDAALRIYPEGPEYEGLQDVIEDHWHQKFADQS